MPDRDHDRDREGEHLVALAAAAEFVDRVDELVLAARQQDEQHPADPSHQRPANIRARAGPSARSTASPTTPAATPPREEAR